MSVQRVFVECLIRGCMNNKTVVCNYGQDIADLRKQIAALEKAVQRLNDESWFKIDGRYDAVGFDSLPKPQEGIKSPY
jgi:hypothetical protein